MTDNQDIYSKLGVSSKKEDVHNGDEGAINHTADEGAELIYRVSPKDQDITKT